MPKGNDEYLGDGAYLSDDGYQLWLANGDHNNKVIALEPEVFIRLVSKGAQRLGHHDGHVDDRIVSALREAADELEALKAPAKEEAQ
jgi:hypothetical protein